MVNPLSITSNETKLFKHLDNLEKIQQKQPSPVMFHISPTNKCNMVCSHCCFDDRDKTQELSTSSLLDFLNYIPKLGTKSIEWTGGGEPTLHPHLNVLTEEAKYYKSQLLLFI